MTITEAPRLGVEKWRLVATDGSATDGSATDRSATDESACCQTVSPMNRWMELATYPGTLYWMDQLANKLKDVPGEH